MDVRKNGAPLMSCLLVCCLSRMVAGSLALLAGSDIVAHPLFHLNMEIDAASSARALDGIQQPWLEYLVW